LQTWPDVERAVLRDPELASARRERRIGGTSADRPLPLQVAKVPRHSSVGHVERRPDRKRDESLLAKNPDSLFVLYSIASPGLSASLPRLG
jgi:hypothetical protein